MLCGVDGCSRCAKKDGLCSGHYKARQRDQVVNRALAKRHASPFGRLEEAALTYAEADSDEEFERARNNLAKSAAAYGHKEAVILVSDISDATRAGMQKRKEQGVHVGRPRAARPAEVLAAWMRLRSVSLTADELGISVRTVRRVLRAVGARTKGGPFVTCRTT